MIKFKYYKVIAGGKEIKGQYIGMVSQLNTPGATHYIKDAEGKEIAFNTSEIEEIHPINTVEEIDKMGKFTAAKKLEEFVGFEEVEKLFNENDEVKVKLELTKHLRNAGRLQ